MTLLTIATRESPLALWQANWVKTQLELLHPTLTVRLLGLTTKADQLDIPLATIGGKGLFVKELEDALLDKRADIAVHSMKDVPMILPEGLVIRVFCEREEPRDVFVSNQFAHFDELPLGAKIGTSSVRRQSQIKALRSDLQLGYLRGNVNTRLAKLDQGEFAGIILAAAGLERLNLTDRIRSYFSLQQSLPAAGQGVLGIECRRDDKAIFNYIDPLNDQKTEHAVRAERALCQRLGGGCQMPVAAYAEIVAKKINLKGLVGSLDGELILRAEQTSDFANPEALGVMVANQLLEQGASALLSPFYGK